MDQVVLRNVTKRFTTKTLGDIVAVDDSVGQVLLCRCMGGPGDTVCDGRRTLIVPGVHACARQESAGFLSTSQSLPRAASGRSPL